MRELGGKFGLLPKEAPWNGMEGLGDPDQKKGTVCEIRKEN